MKKPTVDEICLILHNFHRDVRHALSHSGHRMGSSEQLDAFNAVREKFRAELEEIGIAQHIDWTE